ncbi:hypothetical protein vBPpSSYP_123 [Pseudomonas phage vB_PpS_SYP]|nr:hypothetical protein vBPpSSYP_123 [Pseudomonas phage vB_PpS_SYP]
MKITGHCFCEYEDGIYYEDEASAIDAALTLSLEAQELVPGIKLSYFRGDVVDFESADFITEHQLDNFFEELNYAACDEAGEAAEDFGYHSAEARKELQDFMKAWANKHITCAFYGVRNVVEIKFTVTEQMFNEFMEIDNGR